MYDGTDGVDTGTDGGDCICPCDTGTDGDCIVEKTTYTITVKNPSLVTVKNIMVMDDQLGLMEGPFELLPGEEKEFTVADCLCEETDNTVTVTVDGIPCDEATATVKVDLDCNDTGTNGR